MISRRLYHLFGLWLIVVMVSGALIHHASKSRLAAAESPVKSHLKYSLHEFLFDDELGRNKDEHSIQHVGGLLNISLVGLIQGHWFTSFNTCDVVLTQVDGVPIANDSEADRLLQTSIVRNHIARPTELALRCDYRATPIIVMAVLLAGVFIALYRLMPAPLSNHQLDWLSYLRSRGYGKRQASELVEQSRYCNKELSADQQHRLEALHRPEKRNFRQALEAACDPRIEELDASQLAWLAEVLAADQADLDQALAQVTGPEVVEINLPEKQLRIRGREVEMSNTSFLYYAWYAQKRLEGEGWLVNPQSNRPNLEEGKALAEFMWKYGGHGRSIGDLEDEGLKARVLDQNRSKIKEELSQALGETLADAYLFESGKDDATGRMRYRLAISPDHLQFVY
jgi:hypothetical protein